MLHTNDFNLSNKSICKEPKQFLKLFTLGWNFARNARKIRHAHCPGNTNESNTLLITFNLHKDREAVLSI